MTATTVSERSRLVARGVWLEVLTIGWNAIEAIVAIGAGIATGSVALVGFGLDSVIESISGIALYRRLRFAATSLIHRSAPETSALGIALAAVSLVVMPLLAPKRRTGKALRSRALIADAAETFVCAYLSLALLVGLGLNAALG